MRAIDCQGWLPMALSYCLLFAGVYGTIALVSDHRLRLSDDDIALIVSALRARAAMTTGLRAHRITRLAERLSEGGRGNPRWRLDDFRQTREDELVESAK